MTRGIAYRPGKREQEKKRKTSISLSPEAEYLAVRLGERWTLSFSAAIEQSVRRAALDEGIYLPPVLQEVR